ncbi:MAG TPA: flagellar biosynthetic protein FliR [Opitutaceae bacterium]|jgi:flagellar biosynthetic protein FliR|nr:flagellar biosynthetic protein FliR [Opitutaceae bacterium]
MTLGYLYTWLMVFFRACGLVVLVPQMAGRSPPAMVRVGLATCLATLLVGVVPRAVVPLDFWSMMIAVGGEILLGLAFGFVTQLAFLGVEFAGHIMSSEVGMSVSPGIMGPDMASDPMAAFLSSFAVVLFFMFGGHLAMLSAFARSFALALPGHALFGPGADDLMVAGTSRVIEIGVRMAAPFIALNFLVNLAFSVIGRAVPRMQVFVLSASVRSMAGLGLLSGAAALMARYLYIEFGNLPTQLLQIARP